MNIFVKIRKNFWFQAIITTLLVVFLSFSPQPAKSFPTEISIIDGEQVVLPDWDNISFSDFPPISSGGSAIIDGIERIWQAGQTPDQYLNLLDIFDLSPEVLSLDSIMDMVGFDIGSFDLGEFPIVGEQTLADLVSIVPNLEFESVLDVAPIADLVGNNCGSSLSGNIGNALNSCFDLQNVLLDTLNLSDYALDAIPGLEAIPLDNITNWNNQLISEIPGLSELPLASFPNPITSSGNLVARIDAVWDDSEASRLRSVSGGKRVGFSVPCTDGSCAYIELDDLEKEGKSVRGSFEGISWMRGDQEVRGGSGCLSGREPTGRHPWGGTFKTVVEDIDQTTDEMQTALYFRFCTICGCSPYKIGPVPFITYPVNSLIFLGDTNKDKIYAKYEEQLPTINVKQTAKLPLPETIAKSGEQSSIASGSPITVQVDKLLEIFGQNRSYEEISLYFHGDKGNGRLLGRYKIPSYDKDLISSVSRISGGKQWLKKLADGESIQSSDLATFFPPLEQDALMSKRIEKLRENSPSIEAVATTYGFGSGVQNQDQIDNHFTSMTISDYGKNIALKYGK